MATYGLEKKTDEELKVITDEIVRRMLENEKLKIDKIILYGSYARGDADEGSDIDIMVLCDNTDEDVKKNEHNVFCEGWDIGYNHDIIVQTVTKSKEHFYSWVDDLPYYRNVRDEGIVIYE